MRRADIHVMNERAYADTFAWPQWDVAPGMFVQVHGLKSRRHLEGCVAQVSGLCHETQRVGIRLDDGKVIYVVLQRLSPMYVGLPAVDTAVADATGPPLGEVADCDVAVGDGGIAYDHNYFLALKAVALAYIRRAATDELGVSFDRIAADMATSTTLSASASVEDIRVVVDMLVYEGDCYTTVDDQHVLAL